MKIIYEKAKCIGCGSCAVLCPEFFEMTEDGKAHLKKQPKVDAQAGCIKEAADVCPVKAIRII